MKKSLLFLILLFLVIPLVVAVDYPTLRGFVTDGADLFNAEEEAQLIQLLTFIEENTTVEIAVITVSSLEGLPIETYSIELATKEGIGKKDIDNGMLLLIAPTERQYRFEVGYGLEGTLPDILVSRIGQHHFASTFPEEKYFEGVFGAIQDISQVLQGNEEVVSQYSQDTYKFWFYLAIFIIFFVVMILGRRFSGPGVFIPGGRHSGGSGGFGGFGGGGFGGGGSSGRW